MLSEIAAFFSRIASVFRWKQRRLPQGLTADKFAWLAQRVRARATDLGDNIHVQGSRARGNARPDSDLDIAILVGRDRFEQLVRDSFGMPNPGSAKERTMQHARKTGKIHAGEIGLRALRKELEQYLGMELDISVIRVGGPFDQGPYIRCPKLRGRP